ncbi:hypothetical protein NIES2104_35530 [Leptolyngbya sp. NIES-2104]|nr:hypothetical protein NIES2104_35530 [Leptolyngbya sp. NIES-2104]
MTSSHQRSRVAKINRDRIASKAIRVRIYEIFKGLSLDFDRTGCNRSRRFG